MTDFQTTIARVITAPPEMIDPALVLTRTVILDGRRTRLRLEASVWEGFDEIAEREGVDGQELCERIEALRLPDTPRTALFRMYVLRYFREAAEPRLPR